MISIINLKLDSSNYTITKLILNNLFYHSVMGSDPILIEGMKMFPSFKHFEASPYFGLCRRMPSSLFKPQTNLANI